MTLTLRVRVAKLQKTWNGGGSTTACCIIYSFEQRLAERIQSRTNLYWSLCLCFGLNLRGWAVIGGASVECKLALCLAGSTVKAGLTYTHVNGSISEIDRRQTEREKREKWRKNKKREINQNKVNKGYKLSRKEEKEKESWKERRRGKEEEEEKEKEKKRERQRDIFSGRPKFGEQNKRWNSFEIKLKQNPAFHSISLSRACYYGKIKYLKWH